MRDNIQEPNQPTMNKEQGNKMIAEIMAGNKLIGIFHGAEWSDGTQRLYYEGESMRDFALFIHATNVNIEEAKYYSSWDWLMPVVEKIEELIPDGYTTIHGEEWSKLKGLKDQKIYDFEITTNIRENQHEIKTRSYESKIDSVFKGVVQFIQWYNQQTPTP